LSKSRSGSAGSRIRGGMHEDRFANFERLSRYLLLRSCTKFGWQLSRIVRRGRRHGAVERKHPQRDRRITGSQYFKRPQSRHDGR
jgi:hypothetical protein